MSDAQMYQVGAYVSDGTSLWEVMRVRNEGPAMPRQRRRVTLTSCVNEEHRREVLDQDYDKEFEFVCQPLTDEELYRRYKAIGQEYTPEPRPKPLSYSEELAAKLAARSKPKRLVCP